MDVEKPVLVTGAAGFIGFHVAMRLLKEGGIVAGLDNMNDYYDVNLKRDRLKLLQDFPAFRFHKLDLKDGPAVRDLFRDCRFDLVVHMAAQAGVRYSLTNPASYVDSNLVGFFNILEGCRHGAVKHLVFASSSSVYGANTSMPFSVRQNVDHPLSLYAATKKANELMAHTYAHLYRLPCTGLRFFTVYGPWGRPDMAMHSFTRAVVEGKPLRVFNYGRMRRDFTYIDDIVEAMARIMASPPKPDPAWRGGDPNPGSSCAPYRIYNIGNHQPVELADFIAAIEKALGMEAGKEYLPMQPGDVPATYADIDDLVRDFHFEPAVSISEGVPRFVAWYREYYGV